MKRIPIAHEVITRMDKLGYVKLTSSGQQKKQLNKWKEKLNNGRKSAN